MEIIARPTACDSLGKQLESNDVVIDVPLVMEPALWRGCCIYRVPKKLRKVNEKAYTPKFVSIGPFHHGRKELRGMEMYKLRYFKDFLYRTKKCQEDFRNIIAENEVKIRHCYSESSRLNSKDFVKMILLDAVFIIELFLKEEDEEKAKWKKEEEELAKRKEEKEKAKRKEEEKAKEEAKRKEEEDCKEESDYISSQPWLRDGILHDLILLENQLPFFVLAELYMSAGCDEDQQSKVRKEDPKKEDVKLSCNYSGCLSHHQEGQQIKEHEVDLLEATCRFVKLFRNYFGSCYKDKEPESIIEMDVKHFTDLLRYLFCPPKLETHWKSMVDEWRNQEKSSGTQFCQFCPPKMEQHWNDTKQKWRSKEKSPEQEEESSGIRFCATKLDDAGLKFNKAKDRCLLDIQPPGVLRRFPCFGRPMEVPQLVIDDSTESLLRNLMALEQCHYPDNTYICNYVVLLDCLINTEKDVELLVHKKVIDNLLGSNAIVADLINKLCNHIVETPSSYFDYIAQKVNEHYEYPLNRAMATLKREYFPNIFRGTATVVGLIVLFFTFWSFLKPFVE